MFMTSFNLPPSFFSTRGKKFGLSPYTLLVDIKINGTFGQYVFVSSSKFKVPAAFISKSTKGLFLAQS